jgi:hypothetical protein
LICQVRRGRWGGPSEYGRGSSLPWVAHRYAGGTVAVAGAGVTVLSFLFLPYAAMFTAPEVIKFLVASNPNWILVWLVPLAAVLAGVIASLQQGRQNRRPSSRIDAFGGVRLLAAMVIGAYLLNIIVLYFSGYREGLGMLAVNFLGTGFWFGLFGMIVTYIGATIELRNLLRWRDESAALGDWI